MHVYIMHNIIKQQNKEDVLYSCRDTKMKNIILKFGCLKTCVNEDIVFILFFIIL